MDGRPPALIDAVTLAEALAGPDRPAVLDVRWRLGGPDGRAEHAAGHVPGAVYVDLERELAGPPSAAEGRHPLPALPDLQAAARRWGVRQGGRVVVADDSGGLAAARAWWLLRWGGVEDVRLLDGGLAAWRAAGLPVATGDQAPARGDVVLRGGSMAVVDLDDVRTASGVLVDARAGERYRGEVEPVDARAGHVPGAISLPVTGNLDGDGRFLPVDRLRERFAAAGIDGGTAVAAYCGSGVTAAHEVLALELAGVAAALHPGSWSQWSARPDLPVAIGPEPGQRAPVVLRDADPRATELELDGWSRLHASWGARLVDVDAPRLRRLVARAQDRGFRVEELDADADPQLLALLDATRADFPGGPATAPRDRTATSLTEDRAAGTRWFGVWNRARLVSATGVRREGDSVETDATATLAPYRRRGLAEAAKAASVLALLAEGATVFATGGADENVGSLAMNARLGYEVTERWLTLAPPDSVP